MSQLDEFLAVVDRGCERNRIASAYDRRRWIPVSRYSYRDSANRLLIQERELAMLDCLSSLQVDLSAVRLLDVGCGDGFFLRQFVQWGARPENLAGVDLLPERVESARRLCSPGVRVEFCDASNLPFGDREFDIVLQATMLTSVLDPNIRTTIAAEMLRVLKRGGAILSYDFFVDNPTNPDVLRLSGRDLRLLFPGAKLSLRRLTLAPPLGRLVARRSATLYRILSSMRFLSTHYLAVIRPS